ncbi:hypothetical protein J6590_104314, partial [Homalodisca vitripennis]
MQAEETLKENIKDFKHGKEKDNLGLGKLTLTQMSPASLSTQHVSKLPVDCRKSLLHCTPRCQAE